eukprot:CAMPEP_0117080730 /NCGR_PEP_ID=MMETSP0472-20121206/56942_1 /TAXON_ID=693140 ORGANISM="Tiarina fusus, Strain LIS" /NCGR_SAMPLE_ID=MMETSP0472 /ASSEMBLY_ACC=CAM_ASM_000603 /LENGTH=74 /DNA_ID=CAMNT_0004808455 /DNA_START=13 /DNA_END=237 /DNA_ORIENTATION=-
MPVMGGLEAAKEMRRIGISVPIIAVTGNVMEEDQHKFTECGMNGFLPKPFTPAELKRSLDSVMSQVPPRCPLSP